jgi:hypothetical protein
MRFNLLVAAVLCAAQVPVAAQDRPPPAAGSEQNAPPNQWVSSNALTLLPHARIAFPVAPAGMRITGTVEFSRKGEGLDNAVQYKSADGAVWATAYLFYPGLAHSGLSALATDQAVLAQSKGQVRMAGSRIDAAAGQAGIAVRHDYSGYLGDHASSAAFIKAGRWMIAFRVTGPTARVGEVDAAMRALLDGTRIGSSSPPHPARPLDIADCPAGSGESAARLLPDLEGAELAALGVLATLDGGGMEGKDGSSGEQRFLPARIPPELCLSTRLSVGNSPIAVLRGADGPPRAVDSRTRLVAILTDAGADIEGVHAPRFKRFVLIHHDIARTTLLGSFDGVPSDEQILAIVSGRDQPATRPRVPVEFRPGKGPVVHLPGPTPEAAARSTV